VDKDQGRQLQHGIVSLRRLSRVKPTRAVVHLWILLIVLQGFGLPRSTSISLFLLSLFLQMQWWWDGQNPPIRMDEGFFLQRMEPTFQIRSCAPPRFMEPGGSGGHPVPDCWAHSTYDGYDLPGADR